MSMASASFPTLIPPDQALQLVAETVEPLPPVRVPIERACGLVAAESVRADRDYPPFRRAMMDGFAVRLADAGKTVAVTKTLAAGSVYHETLQVGQVVQIMTGASCPPGTEAVVEKERVRTVGERLVRLPERIEAGRHIAEIGSECQAGQLVFPQGRPITPLAVAAMASFGMVDVAVVPHPSVAVITTGSELVHWGETPAPGRIRNSNAPMLVAMLRDAGVAEVTWDHAIDTAAELRRAIERNRACHMVLFSGGVSVGDFDLVPEILGEQEAVTIFHKVRQKPGKPLLFARADRRYYFGLPGNPLAAHLCCHRYVMAALGKMTGKQAVSPVACGILRAALIPKPGRTYYVPARADWDSHARQWILAPAPGASSADVFSAADANCYIELPPGHKPVPCDSRVNFTFVGQARSAQKDWPW